MGESATRGYGIFASQDDGDGERALSRLTIAQAWIAARKARDEVLDAALFANPAWDILLDLYLSHAQKRGVCVSDVCLASSAPSSTVMRWIVTLEHRGLVERAPDPRDKRRTMLCLSPEGVTKMEAALDASAQSDARLGIGRLRTPK